MTGYTTWMKVAVSLPDELFHRADEVAAQLDLNRSELYAVALREFLEHQGDDPVTVRLNALAEELGTSAGRDLGRRMIDQGSWEW